MVKRIFVKFIFIAFQVKSYCLTLQSSLHFMLVIIHQFWYDYIWRIIKNGMADNIVLLRLGSWIPVIIVHLLICFCYLVYATTFLFPLILNTYKYQSEEAQIGGLNRRGVWYCVVVHILMLVFYYSMIKTMRTLPGRVPKHWKQAIQQEIDEYLQSETQMINRWKEEKKSQRSTNRHALQLLVKPHQTDDTSEVNYDDAQDQSPSDIEIEDNFKLELNLRARIELLEKPGRRFCKRCLSMKPPRTHHCRQCQVCWLKMDHHCQFVNNCIGFGNYKYFFNMIMYVNALLVFMLITYTPTFKSHLADDESGDFKLFIVVFFYLFSWVIGITLMVFLAFHMWLIIMNQTTLEYMENKQDAQGGTYDHGMWANLKAVLGSNCLLWLIPAFPNYEGDGTKF